jgi:hypothetical protein
MDAVIRQFLLIKCGINVKIKPSAVHPEVPAVYYELQKEACLPSGEDD